MATTAITIERPDEIVVAYAEWHRHAHRVRGAYDAWRIADRTERARRYAAYLEELDREQRAAERYAVALTRTGRRAVA